MSLLNTDINKHPYDSTVNISLYDHNSDFITHPPKFPQGVSHLQESVRNEESIQITSAANVSHIFLSFSMKLTLCNHSLRSISYNTDICEIQSSSAYR